MRSNFSKIKAVIAKNVVGVLTFTGSRYGRCGPRVIPIALDIKARRLVPVPVDVRHAVKAGISENNTIYPSRASEAIEAWV